MTLETTHLRLRRFTTGDTAFILELLNTSGWLEFIGDRNVHSIEDARNYLLGGPLKSYTDNSFGLSMMEEKTSGKPVGMCGLIKRAGLADVDLGFAILPRYAGRGFTTEMARAVLNYGFDQLNMPKIAAITVPENTASIRVLKKCGMLEEGRITLPNETRELLYFTISNPRHP